MNQNEAFDEETMLEPEQAAPAEPEAAAEPAAQADQADPTVDLNAIAEALKLKAEKAEADTAAAKDQLLRTAAEYENFRKRSAREQESSFSNGVSHAVTQILGILDTLEIAANAACSDEAYKKGVTMTLDKAAAALAALNVTEIAAQDMPFDPELHSAVMQQPAAEGQQSGMVTSVFQKGYKIGEKVIRHATVVVTE